jgi:diguanylate cyclase (GGDEF)-like protein
VSLWIAWVIGALATTALIWVAGSRHGQAATAVRLLALSAFVRLAGIIVEWANPDAVESQLQTAVLVVSLSVMGLATLLLVYRTSRSAFGQSVAAAVLVAVGASIAAYFHLDLVPAVAEEQSMGSDWEIAVAWAAIGFLAAASIVFMLDGSQQNWASFVYSVSLLGMLAVSVLCPWLFECSPVWWAVLYLLVATAVSLPGRDHLLADDPADETDRRFGVGAAALAAVVIGLGLVGTATGLDDDKRSTAMVAALIFLAVATGMLVWVVRAWRARLSKAGSTPGVGLGDAVAVVELDVDGTMVRASDQLWLMTGLTRTDNLDILSVVHADDQQDLAAAMLQSLEGSREVRRRARLAGTDPVRFVDFRIGPRVVAGAPDGLVVSLSDATDDERRRVQTEQRIKLLEHQAAHDPLTSLANRPHLIRHLKQAIQIEAASGRDVSLLFVDVDDFKSVNDRYGHAGGDAVLIEIGQRLRQATRGDDLVARLGGDEFVIVAQGITPEIAVNLGNRVLDQMKTPFVLGMEQVTVTVSVGLATTDGAVSDPAELLRSADRAMFDAKAEGKNRLVASAEPPVAT